MGKTRDFSRLLSENLNNNIKIANAQMYIGDGGGNAYLNSTSIAVSSVNATTLTVTSIYSNGSLGTSGQVLTSNGSGAYWSSYTSQALGLFSTVQFNDAGYANGAQYVSYDKPTGAFIVGSSTANTRVAFSNVSLNGDSATIFTGNATITGTYSSNGVVLSNTAASGNVSINMSGVQIGNSTVNSQLTSAGLSVNGGVPLNITTVLTYSLAF